MQNQNYNYNRLKKISNLLTLNTCFSPSDPISYRTPRDMLDYKTHVIDKEMLHQKNIFDKLNYILCLLKFGQRFSRIC